MFFSILAKNLNWEVLTKDLVTFKSWDGIRVLQFAVRVERNLPSVRGESEILRGVRGGIFVPKENWGGVILTIRTFLKAKTAGNTEDQLNSKLTCLCVQRAWN